MNSQQTGSSCFKALDLIIQKVNSCLIHSLQSQSQAVLFIFLFIFYCLSIHRAIVYRRDFILSCFSLFISSSRRLLFLGTNVTMNYLEEKKNKKKQAFLHYDMRCEHYVCCGNTGITHTPPNTQKSIPIRIVFCAKRK